MLEVSWTNKALAWVARVAAVLFVLMTAWGWWDESQARQGGTGAASGDWVYQWAIYTHLVPLLLIVLGLALGWKKPFYAGLAFGLYALLGVFSVAGEWIYLPLVVGPPLVIALLFKLGWFISWRKK
ncbi:MAG: hypothetical protein RL670_974 [Actinomycetota bacterium]|jgi:hypothetical protein